MSFLSRAAWICAVGLAGPAFAQCTLPPEAVPGKQVAILCATCHVFDPNKPSSATGPNIHDVFETSAADRKDFVYSDGLSGAADRDLVWTADKLFDYLADPKAFLAKINGHDVDHKMNFHLSDEQKRRDVIAYLKAIKGKATCGGDAPPPPAK